MTSLNQNVLDLKLPSINAFNSFKKPLENNCKITKASNCSIYRAEIKKF